MRKKAALWAVPVLVGAFVITVIFASEKRARAWWADGHALVTRAAVEALPPDMPGFFRERADDLAYYSMNPDLWCDRSMPALRAAERHNHYIDIELLSGTELPKTRPEFTALCGKLRVAPGKVGALPYATIEWHGRLVFAFAKHRADPGDKRAQAEVLYLASVLSHYTGDAGNPLHTTVHYDGRVPPGGKSPRSGIHSKMDALPGRMGVTTDEMARGVRAHSAADAFGTIVAAITESHGHVDRVYELEGNLPTRDDERANPEVRAFAVECCRASVKLTAALWYSAWVQSEKVRLPGWSRAAGH